MARAERAGGSLKDEAPGAGTPRASGFHTKGEKTDMSNHNAVLTGNQSGRNLPVIAGHEVAMDREGRFSLGAIFRASGAGRGKEPSYWTVTKQAQELIAEAESQSKNSWIGNGEPSSPIKTIRGGADRGTYAIDLLAVSYAGWISPKFQLQVNQVFLDYRMGKMKRLEKQKPASSSLIGTTIGTDGFHCLAAVLDGKVRRLPPPARKRAKMHVWSQVHKAFSVVSAEDIPADQMDGARNFIGSYVLEGEWMPAPESAVGETVEDTIARLAEQVKKPNSYPVELFMPLVNAVMDRLGVQHFQRPGEKENYHFPINTAKPPEMFSAHQAWLTVENMVSPEFKRPIQELLEELKRNGHDVRGCKAEYEGLYLLAHRLHVVSKEMGRLSDMGLKFGRNTLFAA